MRGFRFLSPIFGVIVFVLASCASPPPPPSASLPPVQLALSLEDARVVPLDTGTARVSFVAVVTNADSRPVQVEKVEWALSIDGIAIGAGPGPGTIELGSRMSARVPLEMTAAIPETSLGSAAYELSAEASWKNDDGSSAKTLAKATGTFPVIKPPVFSIVSIKIKKAELINTKFEVVLRVANPNPVPLSLRSLGYELYGEGRLWVDGETDEPFPVAASGETERKLTLAMNFINMKRGLLDQVIRLEIVDYRFTGKAVISTELPEYPEFVMPYDLRGRTSVVE